MTRLDLLYALKAETELATKDILLPVARQKGDDDAQGLRRVAIHLMRLPDMSAAAKKAPYIIHQFINGVDTQNPSNSTKSIAAVRSIFTVYNLNDEEGGLSLLNLMERFRIHLLRRRVIGAAFDLHMEEGGGIESLIYPEQTSPYYSGEMLTTWDIPAVEREVNYE